jgi:EmrB/QacA subfamily drug resistance transporter
MEYKNTVLVNTTIGSFMALLDSNIVLISLPTIISSLPGTTTFDGLWIIMGYTLITASFLLTFGRLADLFGRVKLYNLGFAIFTVGSALCSIAPNGISLVIFRLIQGAGGALIFANSTAIITDTFPVEERGRAIGINQVAGTVGSVSGLVAGGLLTGLFGWRSIFWINIPFGTFATVWAYSRLKELSTPLRREKIDYVGNILFASGLSSFLLGLTLGSISGWSFQYYVLIVLGFLILLFFIFYERRARYPMMDLSLFKIPRFSAGIASNLLSSIARGAVSLVLVFYFQGVEGLDPLTSGLLLLPFSIAFVTFGPLSGYLSDRYGQLKFVLAGLTTVTVAVFIFAFFPYGSPYIYLVVPMVLAGAGGGMFVAPNVASIMNSVPVARRGVASGISSMLVNTGFLISLGLAFAIMASSVPLNTLQLIFAGQSVTIDNSGKYLFIQSIHKVFLTMGVVSSLAILPSYFAARRK